MKRVFADTFYWIALINKSDSWYQRVKSYSVNLENIEIITTEEVLTETIFCFLSRTNESSSLSASSSNYSRS
jgi:predicted nucleic acid-binding protein